jgi:glucose-1-phosphate cytidylyltransferase
VTSVHPPSRFGALDVDEAGDRVRTFAEKPQAPTGWINGGFFVFDRRVWDYLDGDDSLVLEREPLERLAADGELMMFRHEGFWQPMDTYREWSILNAMAAAGDLPWLRRP